MTNLFFNNFFLQNQDSLETEERTFPPIFHNFVLMLQKREQMQEIYR